MIHLKTVLLIGLKEHYQSLSMERSLHQWWSQIVH